MILKYINIKKVFEIHTGYQEGLVDIKRLEEEFEEKTRPGIETIENFYKSPVEAPDEEFDKIELLEYELMALREEYSRKIEQAHETLYKETINDLREKSKRYAEENNIDVIESIGEVLYLNEKNDITDIFIEYIQQ